jgi:hypothetical protein
MRYVHTKMEDTFQQKADDTSEESTKCRNTPVERKLLVKTCMVTLQEDSNSGIPMQGASSYRNLWKERA